MKTKEEVINRFINEENVKFNQERDDWMIEAMEEYAKLYHQREVKKLNIPVVSKRKYWYRDNVEVCVLCGKETHNRERVYNESEKGTSWTENACWGHF